MLLKKAAGVLTGYFRRFLQLFHSIDADYILIHREMAPYGPPVLEWLLIKIFRKKIIFDFDDAIWTSDDVARGGWIKFLKWQGKISWTCRNSHRISVGNSYLSDFARRFNQDVTINPTTIDTSVTAGFGTEHHNKPVAVGWTGSHTTLKYLEMIRKPLSKILSDYDYLHFLLICNRKPEWEMTRMKFIPWNRIDEWDDLSRIQIGVMPLPDDPWTRGKGGFKILEYFALGIPALASPVGINNRLIEHGKNGFLCADEKDWLRYLEILVQDPSLRREMGLAGKRFLEDNFSLKSNLDTFLNLFE